MSTIIAVENYEVSGKHGVFDHEREKDQPFVVSIWVTQMLTTKGWSFSLSWSKTPCLPLTS